ncbi:MAG: Cyclic di-GMP phosphodiesterase response regulator RpfG [Syntrophomonadaceae bacterium]|nr:Cyclic di-GMP phosphodiesterase response regulator RpfG [Bacillota bacterium]
MSFQKKSLAYKVYFFLIVLAGTLFLLFNLPPAGALVWPLVFFVFLQAGAEVLRVPLPRGQGTVSVGFALDLAMIIIFGPAAAAWTSFVSTVLLFVFERRWARWYQTLFNALLFPLVVGLSGYVYLELGGRSGAIRLPGDLVPLFGSASAYLLLNVLLVTIVLALWQKISFRANYLTNMRWALPNYLALAPLGLLLAVLYLNMGVLGVLLLAVPLLLARHTFLLYMKMREQHLGTIRALVRAMEAKDHYTCGHSERVAEYSVLIGQELRLREDILEKLEAVALLHDIGKIGIPEAVLNKPGRFTSEEYDVMRSHPATGAEIVKNIQFISSYAEVVRYHHERLDGHGYPNGRTGEEICLATRIVAVADAFDAMTSGRPYHQPKTLSQAVAEMQLCSGTQFCADVTAALVRALRRRGELK